jgi:hypothetical protein
VGQFNPILEENRGVNAVATARPSVCTGRAAETPQPRDGSARLADHVLDQMGVGEIATWAYFRDLGQNIARSMSI